MSTKYIKKQEKNITKIAKYINKKIGGGSAGR
jgi:hypothetical protein